MLFGRVKGTAVCSIKYPGTEGLKLLVVQPLNKKQEPVGALQVAADVVDAGPGDLCVMVRSREAALAMQEVKFVPIDLALVGMTIDVRRPGDTEAELFTTGAGAAVKGSPVNSLVWLANTLASLGTPCRAGEVILTGSLSVMAWVREPQTITCEFGGLGSCTVTFV